MAVEEAGPASDRRLAVRPDNPAGYLNFAITDSVFGLSTQDNARLAVCGTYYDDPALAGLTFRPEAYQTDHYRHLTAGFTPTDIAVRLDGTGAWRDTYFEIPDMKFYGANQAPQESARFFLQGPIFFTAVRYAVIRPCGPMAGVNLLSGCKPVIAPRLSIAQSSSTIRLFWPTNATGFTLQSTLRLAPPQWTVLSDTPTTEGDQSVVMIQPVPDTRFFRLSR